MRARIATVIEKRKRAEGSVGGDSITTRKKKERKNEAEREGLGWRGEAMRM